jgi:multiple sugar transport system permease protein
VATVAIHAFYTSWNEFTAALIFLTSDKANTLPVGLARMAQSQRYYTAWDILMTGSVLSFIPVLIIFLLFQRYFVQGLMAGATKG